MASKLIGLPFLLGMGTSFVKNNDHKADPGI